MGTKFFSFALMVIKLNSEVISVSHFLGPYITLFSHHLIKKENEKIRYQGLLLTLEFEPLCCNANIGNYLKVDAKRQRVICNTTKVNVHFI